MLRSCKPRRQSARWLDGDCPSKVLAIYDNPNFCDRYTVFYTEYTTDQETNRLFIQFRAMSPEPSSAQGFGMSGEMMDHQAADYRYYNRKRACKWSNLPEEVKRMVRDDVAEIEGQNAPDWVKEERGS